MTKFRVQTINSDEIWNEKHRYKTNECVLHLGNIYQNITGRNSEPGVGDDWLNLTASGSPTLQQVTDAGSTTTNLMFITNGANTSVLGATTISVNDADESSYLNKDGFTSENTSTNKKATLSAVNGVMVSTGGSGRQGTIKSDNLTSNKTVQIPDENAVLETKPIIRTITAATTLVIADKTINVSSGTFTQSIFTAVGNSGKVLNFINSGNGIITLDPDGSETINGVATAIVPSKTGLTIQSDGTNWIIIDKFRAETLSRTQWIQPISPTTIANAASLNLFTLISDANKSANGTDGGIYELSVATDKILTKWHGEKMTHHIRISCTIVTGSDQHYLLTLRRYSDNSVLGMVQLNRNADTGLFTADFLTYTYSSTDPFVTDGFYIQMDNNSGASVDISTSINLLIVTYFK